MRNLNRNCRSIYYALRTGERPIIDEYGNETAESTPIYGAPLVYKCNVSASAGQDAVSAFGNFTNYNRTITVADADCPIDENTIIWFGVDPEGPHNYIVVRKADSKNGILYALREVTVR
jgi:hypothetical protein